MSPVRKLMWRIFAMTAATSFLFLDSSTAAGSIIKVRPIIVRDVDNPAFDPLQLTQFCGATSSTTITCQPAVVPANKRLVLEFVGLIADGGINDPLVSIRLQSGGSISPALYVVAKPGDLVLKPGGTAYEAVFNQTVKIYFDPGETVEISASFVNNANSPKNLQINLQGYYVTLP